MDKVYLVNEYFNNGEDYECECGGNIIRGAFYTKEDAEKAIMEMDIPVEYYSKEQYMEVQEGDPLYIYSSAFGEHIIRNFIHKTRERYGGEPVYETLAYFVYEVPFGNLTLPE